MNKLLKSNALHKKLIIRLLVSVTIIGLVFGLGFVFGQKNSDIDKVTELDFGSLFQQDEVDFSLVQDAWNLINEEYVNADGLDQEALIYGAIRGMLDALNDPYTVFFDKKETANFLSNVSGSFEGIGIEIGIRDDLLTVISPLKNSPAERAGMRAGDKIIGIDGEDSTSITLEEAVSIIRGPVGTLVVLTILRGEKEELDIDIIRDTIEVPSVIWEILENDIVYIELVQFSEITARDFSLAIQEILELNVDKIILDVRNNPGGFLDVAIDIAGWFLPKGKIVVSEELGDGTKRIHRSRGPGSLENFSVVILINEGSASASEILAGALRDNNNTTLLGKKSFGKGSVQTLKDLNGGTSIKLTVARWITPSGQQINDTGIEPDIEVEFTQEDFETERDPQRDKALEIIKNRF